MNRQSRDQITRTRLAEILKLRSTKIATAAVVSIRAAILQDAEYQQLHVPANFPFSIKWTSEPCKYRYEPHNDVSVNDGPHIRRRLHKIII